MDIYKEICPVCGYELIEDEYPPGELYFLCLKCGFDNKPSEIEEEIPF